MTESQMERLARLKKQAEHHLQRPLSLEQTYFYYLEMARDRSQSAEKRKQWKALAVELKGRLGRTTALSREPGPNDVPLI